MQVPDLDDWVSINKKRSPDQQKVQQAAAVILWADKAKNFESFGKVRIVEFSEEQRQLFDGILDQSVKKRGLEYIMKAINDEQLSLQRDGVLYTLLDASGNKALFRIRTEEQLAAFTEPDNEQQTDEVGAQTYAPENSFFGLAPELRQAITSQMTLQELLELHRTSNDIIRGTLQTGPQLIQMIKDQFYAVLTDLLAFSQTEEGEWNIEKILIKRALLNHMHKI